MYESVGGQALARGEQPLDLKLFQADLNFDREHPATLRRRPHPIRTSSRTGRRPAVRLG